MPLVPNAIHKNSKCMCTERTNDSYNEKKDLYSARICLSFLVQGSMARVLEPATTAGLKAGSLVPSTRINKQISFTLPRSTGLRVLFPARKPSAFASVHSLVSHRQVLTKGIVCEQRQQEAYVQVGAVTDKTWKELVLEAEVPVLVDFWAPWCGPCRMIAPLMDELAKDYAGRIRCLKLNTDESPGKATEYGIRSIPTVLIFKGGEKKDAIVGAVPKAALISAVEKYLDR